MIATLHDVLGMPQNTRLSAQGVKQRNVHEATKAAGSVLWERGFVRSQIGQISHE